MNELPVRYRPGRIARIRRRIEKHEGRLSTALERLEEAVTQRLPPARLRKKIRERPYKIIAVGLLAGLVVGSLLGGGRRR